MRILGLLLGLAVICSNANASIILTIGTASANAGNGTVTVDVFARTNANDSLITIAADFTLQAGTFGSTAGVFGVDSTYIGGAGFNGQGASNISTATSSFAGAGNLGALSIEFLATQPFLAGDAKIATLIIDKSGLAAGTYTITASNLDTTPGTTNNILNPGSFQIVSAVPEPTSIALLSVAIGGVFGRRLLRSRKKLASVA